MQTAAIRKENTIEQTLDGFNVGFSNVEDMLAFHRRQDADSTWIRLPVNQIRMKALPDAPLLAAQVRGNEKIEAPLETLTDTIEGSGLLVSDGLGRTYCVRDTALKTILERACVSGAALSRLSREDLATVLNLCLRTGKGDALMLYRDGKVGAIHGGDEKDYSILPISELLAAFTEKNDERFPGSIFDGGYTDPSVTTAEWSMPFQAAEFLKRYTLEGRFFSRKSTHRRGASKKSTLMKATAIIHK